MLIAGVITGPIFNRLQGKYNPGTYCNRSMSPSYTPLFGISDNKRAPSVNGARLL